MFLNISLTVSNITNLTEAYIYLARQAHTINDHHDHLLDLSHAVTAMWLIIAGAACFLMQGGFAFVEAGHVRSKNVSGIIIKNILDACVSTIIFYIWGYAFAFGGTSENPNNFIGTSRFALSDALPREFAFWFFQSAFCATSTTIVSGSVAERVSFLTYILNAGVMAGWIYPVLVHASWSTHGWFSPYNEGISPKIGAPLTGVIDFAGSGVVHMCGGVAGLVAAAIVAPRKNRFDEDGNIRAMPPHNQVLSALGVVFLFFSWFFFNAGSSIDILHKRYEIAGRVVVNTLLSGLTGASSALLTRVISSHGAEWNLMVLLDGCLAGCVAICASCAVVEPWAALIIGTGGGIVYVMSSYFILHYLRIDDAVDASAIHGVGGAYGLLMVGFFATPSYIKQTYQMSPQYAGVFMGGSGIQLGYQLLFVLFIAGWVGIFAASFWGVVRVTYGVRITEQEEDIGTDEMFGGDAYDYIATARAAKHMEERLARIEKRLGLHNERGPSLKKGDFMRLFPSYQSVFGVALRQLPASPTLEEIPQFNPEEPNEPTL